MQSTPFIIEQVLKAQKEAYLCFIDFIMVFDRVRYDEITTQLTQLKIDGENLCVIKKHKLGTESSDGS